MEELDKINGELNEIVENEIFGEHILPKQDLIQRARDFALRSLNGDIKKGSKEDYYMFLVSKFLLFKEMVIKKDSKKNSNKDLEKKSNGSKLYFNYAENKGYLPMIKFIVDYIKENIKESFSTNVIINNLDDKDVNKEELSFYIWVFNKLRDSFAHGKYDFDFNNGRLIIDNEKYFNKFTLPIEYLEFIVYMDFSKKKLSDEDKEKYRKEANKYRSFFNYINSGSVNIVSDYEDYIMQCIYYSGVERNMNNSCNNCETCSIDVYEEKQKEFSILLREIKNCGLLTGEQLIKLDEKLTNIGLYDIETADLKKNIYSEPLYLEKIEFVISQFSRFLNLNNESDENVSEKLDSEKNFFNKISDEISLAAVYNYMQLFFCLNDFNFKPDELKPDELKYFRFSKIKFEYEYGDNAPKYVEIVNSIKTETESFISNMKTAIKRYKNFPYESTMKNMDNLYDNYYSLVIKKFESKNIEILRCIRNATAHPDIKCVDGIITFSNYNGLNETTEKNEQSGESSIMSQNQNTNIGFHCSGSAKDFFEVTKALEMGDTKLGFTLNEFLGELKPLIGEETYEALTSVLSQYQKEVAIYKKTKESQLVNVLNQIKLGK